MHLTRMRLCDVPPFTEPIEFKFNEHINVLVGPNASGKSTLLLVLANHFKVLDEASQTKRPFADLRLQDMYDYAFVGYSRDGDLQFDALARSEDWIDPDANLDERPKDPIVVHIGPVRVGLTGISALYAEDGRDQTVADILSGPFSGSQTLMAIDALARDAQANQPDITKIMKIHGIRKAIEIAVKCSKEICNEVINDTTTRQYVPEFDSRVVPDDPVGHIEQPRVLRGAAIGTSDIRNFSNYPVREKPAWDRYGDNLDSAPIYIGHLSSGTEATLLWIQWLALKMLHHYEFADGWEKWPAILLIDEIENHLHPTWQRRVIPALLKHFPGLQIFATTHSPFVVAGLKAGQVHLLNRDANGVVTASTNTEDIVGWTADEILRTMMGVQDPTDDETARNAAELRRLRDEGSRPTDEEEEHRQAEMQRLRRLVNRDLLAGGRAAAQRELFEQQFAEALEKYQRSRDLGQDSG